MDTAADSMVIPDMARYMTVDSMVIMEDMDMDMDIHTAMHQDT